MNWSAAGLILAIGIFAVILFWAFATITSRGLSKASMKNAKSTRNSASLALLFGAVLFAVLGGIS